uniref:Uncharacterized protein n=1 Tax=Arundo donax TaxID=35708 RepID=A0A0A9C8K1_ARUDO
MTSTSHVHDHRHSYSNRFTLCRGIQIYPHEMLRPIPSSW